MGPSWPNSLSLCFLGVVFRDSVEIEFRGYRAKGFNRDCSNELREYRADGCNET